MFKLPGYRRRKAKRQLKALEQWDGLPMCTTARGFFDAGDYVGVEAAYMAEAAAQRKRIERKHKGNT